MLRPAKMKKIKVIALKNSQNTLLTALHKTGLVQFYDVSKKVPAQRDYFDLKETTAKIIQLNRIIDTFDTTVTKKQSKLTMIRDMISPKMIEKKDVGDNLGEILKNVNRILKEMNAEELFQKLSYLREQKSIYETQLEYLEYLNFIDVDLNEIFNSTFTSTVFGFIDYGSYATLTEELGELADKSAYLNHMDIAKEKKTVICAMCLKKDLNSIHDALQKVNFEPFELKTDLQGTPTTLVSEFQGKITSSSEEEQILIGKIQSLKEEWEDELVAYKERLEIIKDRFNVVNEFTRTENVFACSCWAKAADVDKITEIIEKKTKNHCYLEVSDPNEDETVPTVLDNPKIVQPFESLVHMFGSPNYKEFDPTIIIAPIFVLFFAFMLGDAIYGALVLVFSFVMLRGVGKYSPSLRNTAIVLAWCGAATIIVGIFINSYLGDLFVYLGINPPHVLNGIDDAIILLILALFMGIIHLFIGIMMGTIQLIREGKIKDAILTRLIWYPLSISAFMVITYITEITSFKILSVPEVSESELRVYLGIMLTCATLILINQGPLGFFEFTGFLGDWLSYARILALGLATSGLALTINLLADIFWGTAFVLGFIIACIIFIVGHVINCALQVLGAFIHSLRLQYVEFFSKFYEGRGKVFKPYIEETFYTK